MKIRLFFFFFLIHSLLFAQQADYQKPRLVIGITIEGLSADYLSMFWNGLSHNGFRKIVENGAVLTSLKYDYDATDNLSDLATFTTGTQPYLHGITWSEVYNRNLRKQIFVLNDENEKSVNGIENVSARNILTTTLADELKVNTIQRSKVISIAMNAKHSIVQAGHLADAVMWIDDQTAKWTTSTYYAPRLPIWAERKNQQGSMQNYMQMVWEPLYPINYYYVTQSKGFAEKGFSYPLKKITTVKQGITEFKKTPFANTYIREMAVDAIEQEALGKDIFPDLLLLYFSLQSYPKSNELSVELEDAYLRLDNDIKMIIDAAERRVGKNNVLFYIQSPRKTDNPVAPFLKEKMQFGMFNSFRYMALLNSYLMAIYGQENWVQHTLNGHIYLNRKRIEEKNISLKEIQERAIEFVSQLPGVMNAVSAVALEQQFALRNTIRYSYSKNTSGDIIYSLYPGWYEVGRDEKPTGFYNVIESNIPFYLYGWKVSPQKITTVHQIIDVATTLASWLHISAPNAANGVLLPVVLSND